MDLTKEIEEQVNSETLYELEARLSSFENIPKFDNLTEWNTNNRKQTGSDLFSSSLNLKGDEENLPQRKKNTYSAWSEVENTWLVGLVFDQIFATGCLPPQKDGSSIWEKIYTGFEMQRKNYVSSSQSRHDILPGGRSPSGLKRRFKTLRGVVARENKPEYFREIYRKWEETKSRKYQS
eukprot:snap_masked-scaffold_2-processed-gene-27.41-mRNA-1 protein AED:1.00 eAED:1.00 QI:0/-1/0/0/-1/1/1/0/178